MFSCLALKPTLWVPLWFSQVSATLLWRWMSFMLTQSQTLRVQMELQRLLWAQPTTRLTLWFSCQQFKKQNELSSFMCNLQAQTSLRTRPTLKSRLLTVRMPQLHLRLSWQTQAPTHTVRLLGHQTYTLSANSLCLSHLSALWPNLQLYRLLWELQQITQARMEYHK